MPIYSFIVSIYNIEKYLAQCIESLLAQTYPNFEVLLIDDGSCDTSSAICESYKAIDRRVKVIHKKNGGVISTRKSGLAAAAGEYICFIDGDDFIAPTMLEKYNTAIEQYHPDIVCAGYTMYWDDRSILVNQKIENGFYNKEELNRLVYPQMLSTRPFFNFYIIPSVCTKCFKRELLLPIYQIVPDNISLGEDAAVTYAALLSAASIVVLESGDYMYRQNPNSMTHVYDKKLYAKLCTLLTHLKKVSAGATYHFDNQINEYTIFLLYQARNNELSFNREASYREKKKNMLQYLNNSLFCDALQTAKIPGLKDKFLIYCLRHKMIFALYLICNRRNGFSSNGSNK